MQCPHCNKTLADSPDLAGQTVLCPLCGGEFGLSGKTAPVANFRPEPPAYRRQQSAVRRPSAMKTLLLLLTFAYLLSIAGIVGFAFYSAEQDRRVMEQAKASYQKVPGGYRDPKTGEIYSDEIMKKGFEISGGLISLLSRGVACAGLSVATVVYFVLAGVMLIVHFASS